jgi:malate synthase
VWQWVHGGVVLASGTKVTEELVRQVVEDEFARIRDAEGAAFADGRWQQARQVFEQVALADDFVDFLTLPAYELID